MVVISFHPGFAEQTKEPVVEAVQVDDCSSEGAVPAGATTTVISPYGTDPVPFTRTRPVTEEFVNSSAP